VGIVTVLLLLPVRSVQLQPIKVCPVLVGFLSVIALLSMVYEVGFAGETMPSFKV
jgi:ABC-type transport system involved in cytochrome c biogenesis permease subunit